MSCWYSGGCVDFDLGFEIVISSLMRWFLGGFKKFLFQYLFGLVRFGGVILLDDMCLGLFLCLDGVSYWFSFDLTIGKYDKFGLLVPTHS